MARALCGWLLAALALVMLFLAWGEVFAPLASTSFGVILGNDPSGKAVAVQVLPRSSAERAGIRRGDEIDISGFTFSQRLRLQVGSSPVGATVVVPVVHNGVRRSVTLRSQFIPRYGQSIFSSFSLLAAATITLLIVALIAVRRPSLATAALVLYGAGAVTTFAVDAQFSWLPDPWYGVVALVITAGFSTLPIVALLPFIVRFPEPPVTRAAILRARAADAFFVLAALASVLQVIYEPLIFETWTFIDTWGQVILMGIVLLFAVSVYREASGEARRRVGWVIGGFVVSAIAYTTYNFSIYFTYGAVSPGWHAVGIASQILQIALPVSLAYAILRHRVLDIGFALNRTMVYAVMTTLVVAVVSFADWLTGRLLSEQRLAVAIEALVTISFGFALNWLHGRTERLIDRIVFRARHIAEKRIEYRVGALEFAASSAAVDDALAVDAAQILGLSSAAVFSRVSANLPFRRAAATGWADGCAMTIDADSILVRTLRSLERPALLDDVAISAEHFPHGAARPVLVIPILSQHEVIGFVLYGNRRDGTLPDPEETALLANLTAAAGAAYGAVEARQWRERAASLEESLRGMAASPLSG